MNIVHQKGIGLEREEGVVPQATNVKEENVKSS